MAPDDDDQDEGEGEGEAPEHKHKHEHHGIYAVADKVRGMGVGMEDPNIIGDAGPTDVPPGSDPPKPADDDA